MADTLGPFVPIGFLLSVQVFPGLVSNTSL
jgi:hypothetical protein